MELLPQKNVLFTAIGGAGEPGRISSDGQDGMPGAPGSNATERTKATVGNSFWSTSLGSHADAKTGWNEWRSWRKVRIILYLVIRLVLAHFIPNCLRMLNQVL